MSDEFKKLAEFHHQHLLNEYSSGKLLTFKGMHLSSDPLGIFIKRRNKLIENTVSICKIPIVAEKELFSINFVVLKHFPENFSGSLKSYKAALIADESASAILGVPLALVENGAELNIGTEYVVTNIMSFSLMGIGLLQVTKNSIIKQVTSSYACVNPTFGGLRAFIVNGDARC